MVDRSHRPAQLSATSKTPQASITFSEDNSRILAKLPTSESVEILLYGASIISWKNANGEENLWLSDAAKLDGSKPVRGGIPIVFPVFGQPPANHATSSLPQHGFARATRWEFLNKSTSETASTKDNADSSVKLDFGLYSSALPDNIRKAWPFDFGLVYSVTLSPNNLQTVLNVRNEGKEAFDFKVLLHTYLKVKDISTATVTGLTGVPYIDKVLNATTHTQVGDLSISGEVDRIYKSIPQSTTSVLQAGTPVFNVSRDNLPDTVIWNPWAEKAKATADFEPKDGYKKMLCVEVGAVNDWQKLDGGESWEGGQIIQRLIGF